MNTIKLENLKSELNNLWDASLKAFINHIFDEFSVTYGYTDVDLLDECGYCAQCEGGKNIDCDFEGGLMHKKIIFIKITEKFYLLTSFCYDSAILEVSDNYKIIHNSLTDEFKTAMSEFLDKHIEQSKSVLSFKYI